MRGRQTVVFTIIILAFVVLCESFVIAGMYVSREREKQNAEEYKVQADALIDDCNRYALDNARLREKNDILDAENAKLNSELQAAITDAALQQNEQKNGESAAGCLPLPDAPTNVISVEDYEIVIEQIQSDQSSFQRRCLTDTEYDSPFRGARYYEHEGKRAYCSALSTNYTKNIGDVFQVELECGYIFNVICSDFKNPLNDTRSDWYGTPCQNYDGEDAACIIELVSDIDILPEIVGNAGTFTAMPELGGLHGHGGNVVRLTKIGRWWEP